MPEGPEIRREADRIARVLKGQRARSVWFAFDHLQRWSNQMKGRVVRGVEPRGKALLIRLGRGLNIYSHNQLYGRWWIVPHGRTPNTGRQLRLAIHTDRHSALLYSASEIEVLRDDELDAHGFLAKLGPDVLDPAVTARHVVERLRDPSFHGRSLGSLLLDQSFVSGLGNYLRSEVLFVSGLTPSARPKDLTDDQRAALADEMLRVTRQAYRHRGVTSDLDDARRLRAEGAPRREYRHWVFGRAGRRCRACGETIQKLAHSGRRIYLCHACQGRAAS